MPASLRFSAVALAFVALYGRDPRTALATPPAPVASSPFHLRLEKSAPASGEVLAAAPTAIKLWFSLAPEIAVTSVRLADAAGKLIPVSAPRRGVGAGNPVEVGLPHTLAIGTYTVSWKTSSTDGHPIKGDFTFTVKAGGN